MINVLFAAGDGQFEQYESHLVQSFKSVGLKADLRCDFAPTDVDYIVYAPSSTLQDFTTYSRCKAVLSLWAGVERIVGNATLTQPLCRMVDDGLTRGMVEWVVGHVFHHHLHLGRQILNPARTWDDTPPPLAKDRRISILGLGALGSACGQALSELGFPVTGWSRREKTVEGIQCLHGDEGFNVVLQSADILVLLLPQTPQTENILDASTLAELPKSAVILNPGRGTLIDDAALLNSLAEGHVSAATLDVFRVEPLPQDHAFWDHPAVTVTPHIASTTRPDSAAQVITQNILRCENGQSLLHQVDRAAGY